MQENQARDAAAEIERYRKQVREKVYARLTSEKEKMVGEGKCPFEGRWLTIEEIRTLRRWLRRRDLEILFELFLLFVCMGFIAYVVYWLLMRFLPPL
jgi:hypothetical protein